MAATSVTSANTNKQGEGARVSVRTSAGIPYVVVFDDTDNGIEVWKGDAATPTSFSEQDTANNPASTNYRCGAAAIDSSDIIHVAYYDVNGKSSALRYVTFDTSTDTFSGDASIQDIGAASPTNPFTAIAVDANDIPHIAWVDSNVNMGTNYDTVYYTNKVGGSWNTAVEVEGVTAERQCKFSDIAIDADNKPTISYGNTTDDDIGTAQGNANNATSFTLFDIETTAGAAGSGMPTSIAVDSSGNHHAAFYDFDASGYDICIRKHNYGDAWTTWQTKEVAWDAEGTVQTANQPVSLVINGTDRYIFLEDNFATHDIVYLTDVSGSWAGPTTLETGTYNTVKAKWARYANRGSDGVNYGGISGIPEIDYTFTDETPSPDVFWNTLSLAAEEGVTPSGEEFIIITS